jgi:hypothetical protein
MQSDNRDKRPAPWRGRGRVADPKTKFISVRCTAADYARIDQNASQAGLSIGAFMRAKALGAPGPRAVRRPRIEYQELARLLGHIGRLGGNINQIARVANANRSTPALQQLSYISHEVLRLRNAIMNALGRGG